MSVWVAQLCLHVLLGTTGLYSRLVNCKKYNVRLCSIAVPLFTNRRQDQDNYPDFETRALSISGSCEKNSVNRLMFSLLCLISYKTSLELLHDWCCLQQCAFDEGAAYSQFDPLIPNFYCTH